MSNVRSYNNVAMVTDTGLKKKINYELIVREFIIKIFRDCTYGKRNQRLEVLQLCAYGQPYNLSQLFWFCIVII